MKKGFSLIELLVVMVISGVLITALYATYINLYSGSKTQSKITESIVEGMINSEILRTDLVNTGFGLADEEKVTGTTDDLYPIGWDNGTFSIRTTYDRLDPRTHGWALLKCESDNASNITCEADNSSGGLGSNPYGGLKVISSLNNREISYSEGSVTAADYYYAMGYPYDPAAADKYITISYRLADDCNGDGTPDRSARCSPNTSVLCRNSLPLVDCAAGWRVFAGYEDGGSIVYDTVDNITAAGDEDSFFSLRRLIVYVLVQEGQFDRNFNFGADNMTKDLDFDAEDNLLDRVIFPLPADGRNYRWNIMTIDARTYNIGKKYEN
ncbi:MAG: PilW family protein [Deferribacterales bacterium]